MRSPDKKISNSSPVIVRQMSAPDVSTVHSILKESPEAAPWSEESLLESAARGIAWTAELDGSVAGILIGRTAADEFEILNLAVAKASRRRGIATRMLATALETARMSGAREAYLEVRASNKGGIAFYSRMGFRVSGRRANYYHDPLEDAVLLALPTDGTAP